jgi:penicillin amidase
MTWWRTYAGWPWPARAAVQLAILLVLVMVMTTITGVVLVRRPFPQTSGELRLPALDAEVDVVRDAHGIPQVYADTTEDLMRAQGFVHAQDRFFQMDLRRHLTAGRLAELLGEPALEADKFVRTLGWRRVAEREWALLEAETRDALTAYAEGVNAWLDRQDATELGIEYTLLRIGGLDHPPEKWTPVDSLAWLKAMAWDLRGNMDDEIGRVLAGVGHTDRQVEELYPPYPYEEHAPVVGGGAVVDGAFEPEATEPGSRNPQRPPFTADQRDLLDDVLATVEGLPEMLGRGSGIGSNAWVVSGDRTTTGAPLLANDPHLGTSLPGVWAQVGLHCREVSEACPYDVSGFSFAGVPGVVIGHNRDIAWGFTNLGPDVTDLYLEKVRGGRWRHDDRWRRMRIRQETIEVAGGEDFDLTIRETAHGPLLSDVSRELSTVGANAAVPLGSPDRHTGYAVALRWTALDPSPTADAILHLNKASDWRSFRAAASRFAVPAQNLVYADREGNSGYQAPGRIPIRKSGNDGRMPSAGWLPENDWTGQYVPFEALPHALNPDEGFLVTANQAVAGEDYPFHLTDDWDPGYRSQRIRELLEADDEVSVDEMAELQLDTHNELAEVLVPHLLDIPLPAGYADDGQALLRDWDGDQAAGSAAAAYFNVTWRELLRLAFHDEMRESQWPDGGGRWWRVVTALLEDPDNAWWDDKHTDEVETRDVVLREAMLAARDELTRRVSRHPEDWEWGRLHRLELRGAGLGSSGSVLAEWMVNRGGWQVGGGGSAVNATAWEAALGYEVTAAPSMRMVVDLGDLDRSRWVNLGGASGHAFHPHSTDQVDLFVEGETLRWPFTPAAVDAAGSETLTLEP